MFMNEENKDSSIKVTLRDIYEILKDKKNIRQYKFFRN